MLGVRYAAGAVRQFLPNWGCLQTVHFDPNCSYANQFQAGRNLCTAIPSDYTVIAQRILWTRFENWVLARNSVCVVYLVWNWLAQVCPKWSKAWLWTATVQLWSWSSAAMILIQRVLCWLCLLREPLGHIVQIQYNRKSAEALHKARTHLQPESNPCLSWNQRTWVNRRQIIWSWLGGHQANTILRADMIL